MTEILQQSLNTGMIHVMRQMGGPQMARFIRAFGFGERLGIELDTEVAGTIDALDKDSEIFYATASYGQGVTVTPFAIGGGLWRSCEQRALHHAAYRIGDSLSRRYRRASRD